MIDRAKSIAIDPSGNVWFRTYDGVIVFDGEDWTTYTENNSGLVSNSIYSIAIGPSGTVWFGAFYDRVSLLVPKDVLTISDSILKLRNYFFSPISIWSTSISLVILWLSIQDKNKPALVGTAGWVLSLLFFGPPQTENLSIIVFVISFSGSVGALIAGRSKGDNGYREKRILKGLWIGLIIGVILAVILAAIYTILQVLIYF